jgi:monoamine oxidase
MSVRQVLNTTVPLSTPPQIFDVLIIGGGLSGLFVGQGLERLQANWRLLEARPTLGGRLLNDAYSQQIDMGGAWLWPEHQPHVRQFLADNSNSIQTFDQPDDPSSTRLRGGTVQLIHTITKNLTQERILLNSPVTHCKLESLHDGNNTTSSQDVVVQVKTSNNETFCARAVVFAVPPKLISKHITFDPPLSESKQAAMAASHTWMVGVTKVALVYASRFWDLNYSNSGLGSGGPAIQVYDSSTHDNTISALTFFAMVPPSSPALQDDALLANQVAQQMAQFWKYRGRPEFSKLADSYTRFYVQRWPTEKYISEDDRPTTIHPHPFPVPALSRPEWEGRLQFAGSETDLKSPGVIEGALGAANRVLSALQDIRTVQDSQCNSVSSKLQS